MTLFLICILWPYLVGSIPSGYILGRWLMGKDIRQMGSGNIGAANVLRNFGIKAGVMTLILDALKGAAAVGLSVLLLKVDDHWGGVAALSAILGHLFPIYLKFRGGKGFATLIGSFLVLTPVAMMLSLVTFLITAVPTRIVSLGSLSAALSLPLFILFFSSHTGLFPFAIVASFLIFIRHSSNIRNLIRGVEPRIGERR